MEEALDGFQQSIHYRFCQVKHLELALTHSSWANEQGEPEKHNERLEFLGDAVLELIVSREAFSRFPLAREGQLTKIRSRLVKERSLADMARGLNLHTFMRLGRGEESQGGRNRDSLLADAFEAVMGAVFLDGGFESAKQVVLELFAERWPDNCDITGTKDYKSRLQEETQRLFRDRPVYALSKTSGPEHAKVFEVCVTLPGDTAFEARGPSLKKAEQNAARRALEYLQADMEDL